MALKDTKIGKSARGKESSARPQAFVIMPIYPKTDAKHDNFRAIYLEYIQPALVAHGFQVRRSDEIAKPGAIMKEIVTYLADSQIVVADLTELNANVFYELGIRHTLRGHGTILLLDESQNSTPPFDLSPYRVIFYKSDLAHLRKLREQLDSTLEELRVATPAVSDNPVHDWLGDRHFSAGKPISKSRTAEPEQMASPLMFDPDAVIQGALRESEAGVLPKDLIEEARKAVRKEEMNRFLEQICDFLELKAFQPTEREYVELYFLANRIEAREVSRAILEFGLRIYPTSEVLSQHRMTHLAHSNIQADRNEAKRLIAEVLGLEIKGDSVEIAALSNVGKLDLLAYILDAYHRDGQDAEALRLAAYLMKLFPESSIARRNFARARYKTSGAPAEEIISAYRAAVLCDSADDTSAIWYANVLREHGRDVDALEALALACMLDLDEAKVYALMAELLSDILQPRNTRRKLDSQRELPVEWVEDVVVDAILMSMSCPNFGPDHRFPIELALSNIGIGVDELAARENESNPPSRRDRREFISKLYEGLKSEVTNHAD